MKDIGDVGLGGETLDCHGVVRSGGGRWGLDGGDAEVLAAMNEACAGDSGAGFGVAGNGSVAIDDEVAMRDDAGGVDLSMHGRARLARIKTAVWRIRREASEDLWSVDTGSYLSFQAEVCIGVRSANSSRRWVEEVTFVLC